MNRNATILSEAESEGPVASKLVGVLLDELLDVGGCREEPFPEVSVESYGKATETIDSNAPILTDIKGKGYLLTQTDCLFFHLDTVVLQLTHQLWRIIIPPPQVGPILLNKLLDIIFRRHDPLQIMSVKHIGFVNETTDSNATLLGDAECEGPVATQAECLVLHLEPLEFRLHLAHRHVDVVRVAVLHFSLVGGCTHRFWLSAPLLLIRYYANEALNDINNVSFKFFSNSGKIKKYFSIPHGRMRNADPGMLKFTNETFFYFRYQEHSYFLCCDAFDIIYLFKNRY
jgi:hypothetical protein